ncbi:MAG: DUF6769 family protein [Tannerellaceae bacterium]
MLKERVIQYTLLVAGILLLFSVVVPHHHHANGLPCYRSLLAEAAESADRDDCTDHSADASGHAAHDCGCNGHNQALFTSLESHITGGDAMLHLYPLLTLFAYLYPSELLNRDIVFLWEEPVYIESLRDHWVARATGLRAPPARI